MKATNKEGHGGEGLTAVLHHRLLVAGCNRSLMENLHAVKVQSLSSTQLGEFEHEINFCI